VLVVEDIGGKQFVDLTVVELNVIDIVVVGLTVT